jgi:CspA family cold shock protein
LQLERVKILREEEKLSLYERGVQIYNKIKEERENSEKEKEEKRLKKQKKLKDKILKDQKFKDEILKEQQLKDKALKEQKELKFEKELEKKQMNENEKIIDQKIFEEQKNKRIRGNVKWFNANKGYGFIEREDGKKDIFVHISAVNNAGLKTLKTGEALTFEVEVSDRGDTSINLQKIS